MPIDGDRRILDNLLTAVIELDEQGKVAYLNSAAESLLGHSRRQLLGISAKMIFATSPHVFKLIQQASTEGQSLIRRELEISYSPVERTRKVDCSFHPIITQSGTRLLLEMRNVDRALRIAREESLIAQQHAMKLLVRGLAHEVKNPLGGLRGAAQLLERQLPDAALREYTQIIIGEADRLQKLVDELLGPNKIVSREPLNIHEVLEHVRQLVSAGSPPSLTFVRDYDPSIPDIRADRNQLIQVVLNIVRNAKEALADQGRITLRSRALSQFTIGHTCHRLVLRVDIIDNGPGIPTELLDQIFYPMVTSKPNGTGLGLSIAQTIIGQHGGLVECRSEPGHTVFSILLPINEQQP
ncbi:MAG: nitrogen regulation protein NR(II) [Gammaproteobacteria bacterium]|nr:nitrogen regulation protein NR(II) [Gammaproteobacteria bacterium]